MKIVSPVVTTEFIELQYYSFKKYMKCEYEFIVFNDAKNFPDITNFGDVTIKNKIHLLCNRLNIKCIDVPNEHHIYQKGASHRTADSCNFITKYMLNNPDEYLSIDSDMWLIGDFNQNIRNYNCGVVYQTRPLSIYPWNGFFYINMYKCNRLDLIKWDLISDCDTGGACKEWLKYQTNIYDIKHLISQQWNNTELSKNTKIDQNIKNCLEHDFRNKDDKFFTELYDDTFIHFRAGGNWMDFDKVKYIELIQNLKNNLLSNNSINISFIK